MNTAEMARRVGSAARVLMAASLFFVLVWWVIAAWLFCAGALLAAVGWVLDGAVWATPSLPAAAVTAPE